MRTSGTTNITDEIEAENAETPISHPPSRSYRLQPTKPQIRRQTDSLVADFEASGGVIRRYPSNARGEIGGGIHSRRRARPMIKRATKRTA
jgi:hypothetical protein